VNKQQASHKVVLIGAMITFGLGWFNAEKHGKNPSARFLIGAGVTFTMLSFLADFSPEAANALALAITTTALFSEGNGVLSYINQAGELNTPDAKQEKHSQTPRQHPVKKNAHEHVGQIPGL
jgi:hypothetical protein